MSVDTVLEVARVILGAAVVVANLAVWYGVWLERETAPKEVQHKGWRILVGGLAAETALSLLLFTVDTQIGRRQADEIVAAQVRAANAEREAGRLGVDVRHLSGFVAEQERQIDSEIAGFKAFAADESQRTATAIAELNRDKQDLDNKRAEAVAAAQSAKRDVNSAVAAIELERRTLAPRVISPAQQAATAPHLLRFKGTSAAVWIGFGGSSDVQPLAGAILGILEKAQWQVRGTSISHSATGTGVFLGKRDSSPEAVRAAGDALIVELSALGIDARWEPKLNSESTLENGISENVFHAEPPDLIVFVGSKY